jgi:hypothetical protein
MLSAVKDVLPHLVIVGALALAAVRVWRAPIRAEATMEAAMSPAQARQTYLDVTEREPAERRDAALRFPGSAWSEQDDFHARERSLVRSVAMSRGLGVSSIVAALDQGMRENWPTRSGVMVSQRVIPCRPRLTY